MSFRALMFAVAIGLTAGLVPGDSSGQTAPESQPRQEESGPASSEVSQEQDPSAVDISPALNGIEAAIRELIAEEDAIARKEAEALEKRDLKAQEGMAWWAELMFYATGAMTVLTFAALIAIIRTLKHTKRAADYAQDMVREAKATTEAAEKTVEATKDIARIELRAYVGVKSVTITFGQDGQDFDARIVIRVANTGSTPAIIQFHSTKNQIEFYGGDTAGPKGWGATALRNESVLGPNSEFYLRSGRSVIMHPSEASKLRFKVGHFIRFTDIYGEEHVEASWWLHQPIRTDSLVDGLVLNLYTLRQAPHALEDLSDENWN